MPTLTSTEKHRLVATEMLLIILSNNLDELKGTTMYSRLANLREQAKRLQSTIDMHCKQFYTGQAAGEIADQSASGAEVFDVLMLACLRVVDLPETGQEAFSQEMNLMLDKYQLRGEL